ncbi:MAG: DUF3568 family protein [Longimicrobiales bacterium]
MSARNRLPVLGVLAVLPLIAGCAAAAGAAAGAAGAVAYSERGATATVDAPLNDVVAAAEATLNEMGIAIVERDTETDDVELTGNRGDLEVNVDIERSGSVTEIEVTAKEGTLDYDRDQARDIVARIVQRL